MADFKCKDGIYSLEYDEFRSPQIWWKFVDNDKNNNQLRNIALKLFAIVPHSASCERNFSNLGWFYGNRQQNLNITTIESMSKIRHYYLTNTRSELQYSGKNYTEEELAEVLKESNLFNEEELEEDDNYNNLESEIVEADQIPQHEVYVLVMANDINLSEPVFDNESNEIDSTRANEELITNDSENENEFDINEIITNTSFKF
ncbi:unnamed protein product [Rhizophagus irregularis]|uniref:HAT C-terminal dimerisation domain-containing protein n=1 Tax=Rhizophagus irregularis TaxID=588596 RepID=A0A2I1FWA9_9GLOM|nr:hypothetical protein RhiirA4_451695 [Rhizophagus irregularis]CAB4431117.1 unnamed protein product [Rhizophagus irregularis]